MNGHENVYLLLVITDRIQLEMYMHYSQELESSDLHTKLLF